MTEDQKSIAERAEYHKGNLKDLTKDEIVHFLPAVLANKDAVIAELRAALAKSQPVEQGKPVAKVVSSGPADFPILQWISAELSLSTKTGDLLYTHPVRPMSDEPRYTVDQIADAACHAEVNDSKFESMCVYLGGIKGAKE